MKHATLVPLRTVMHRCHPDLGGGVFRESPFHHGRFRLSIYTVEYTFEDTRGHATLKSVGAGVMLFEAVGYYTFELSRQASDAMTEVARTASDLHIFVDFSAMSGYESRSRAHATAWCRDHFKAVSSVHILTKTGLVAMGVATAAMTLSMMGMRFLSYTDRSVFLAEFESTKRRLSTGA